MFKATFRDLKSKLLAGGLVLVLTGGLLTTPLRQEFFSFSSEGRQHGFLVWRTDDAKPLNLNEGLRPGDKSERFILTSLLGVFSGQLVRSSQVQSIIYQLNEYDARQTLIEWKRLTEELATLYALKGSNEYATVLYKIQMLAKQKMEYERQFGKLVGFYDDNHLNPSTALVMPVDKAAAIYANRYGGGEYDPTLDLVVPRNPELVRQRWLELKNIIAKEIGVVVPRENSESDSWTNTAKSIDELISDAKRAAVLLIPLVERVVAKVENAQYAFGPNFRNIIKSEHALRNKIARYQVIKSSSEEEVLPYMNDTVRGTLIGESVEDLLLLIDRFREEAVKAGWEIGFTNYWEAERPFGYVAVHAKLKIPLPDDPQKWILGEMQFHLKSLNDGTFHALKERQHEIYVLLRRPGVDEGVFERFSAASMLLYVAVFEEIVDKLKAAKS